MSVHVSAAVYKAKFGSPTRKALAVKLADISNDDGASIFMSVGRMARELEMGERTVQRLLKEFVDEGLLVVDRIGGRGPRSTTHYRFDLDAIAALPRTAQDKGATAAPLPKTSRVPPATTKGATEDRKGAAVAPNPSVDNIIDPSEEREGAQARNAPAGDAGFVLEGEIVTDEPVKPQRKQKRRLLADDWTPGEAGLAFAREKGLADQQIAGAFEKFKAHHQAKGSAMADWPAAWRTWVLNEIKFARAAPPPGRKPGRFSASDYLNS